jgi:LysM repeat protein
MTRRRGEECHLGWSRASEKFGARSGNEMAETRGMRIFSEIMICDEWSHFPQWGRMIDQATMKPLIWLPLSCAAVLLFNSCANNGSTSGNDPLGTGPFDAQGNYREDWADDPTKWRKPGSRQAAAAELPAIAANDVPPANANPLPPAGSSSSPKPSSAKPSDSTASSSRPKTVASKPKPKPKPTSTTHTVKSGDTLSGIASRYGSTVAKIRSANGISGSMIRPGQKLKVPKR